MRILDPGAFGKVAVLLGGDSAEREISLMSGTAVHQALVRRGVDAHAVDAGGDLLHRLQHEDFDRAWIVLHGRGGEDGTIQGLLGFLGLPFTGSSVLGSALSMDKLKTKRLLSGAGLGTPRYRVLESERDFEIAVKELGLPMMVKPSAEGSSLGLTRVARPEQMAGAYRAAARFHCEVFAEEWVTGPEYTAAILRDRVLPLIRIEAQNTFYDYQAKYFTDDTRYVCPCGLPQPREQALGAVAMEAFQAVGAAGWGRVDFMLGADGQALILEVNTVPGMTGHSLFPMAAAAVGMGFDELVWRILETSFTGPSELLEPPEAAQGA